MTTGEGLIRKFEQAKTDTERQNWETLWQDVSKFTHPRKAYYTRKRTPGSKMDTDVYDSTAIQANIVLAAGLHSYLTNPSSKWFTLRTHDGAYMDDKAVALWLKHAEDKIYDVLNGSNFSQQIHEAYLELGSIGTACLYCEEDPRNTVRFYCRPMSEVVIAEGADERVDTIFRKFPLTARQALGLFGKRAGKAVTGRLEAKKDFDKLDFLHVVLPRHDRDVGKKDAQNMPFASYILEISEKELLAVGGYEEFPYFVGRFNKNPGEVYGSSPGIVSYSDIKMLNAMAFYLIRAAQKQIDPPMILPHDGFLTPIKLGPAGINYRTRTSQNDQIEFLVPPGKLSIGTEMLARSQEIIGRNFFVDLFLAMASAKDQGMTATEVNERIEEKMLILAPTLGRLMNEFLDPIISRTFNILLRNFALEPMPQVLQGLDYVVEYTSPLARAQKMFEMRSINTVINTVGAVAQMLPSVLDKIDPDKFVDQVSKVNNIHASIIRSDEEVRAIREQRAQAQEAQAQLAMAQQGADVVKTGAEADKIMKEGQSA